MHTRHFIIGLIITILALGWISSCADDDVRPAAFINPTTGEQCTAWVNNPHEADGSGHRACDFPIPQTQPVRSPGMSDADWALIGFMYGYGAGHSAYYFSPGYYDRYIGPAWSRYPGTYYGYGHQPITRITNYTTVMNNYSRSNATTIRTAQADPKLSGYTGSSGKTYTGTTVPAKSFSGGNTSRYSSGGNAGTSGGSSGGGSGGLFGGSSGSSGKSGYTPPRVSGGGRK